MIENILNSRIELRKPILKRIKAQGFNAMDMHVHTRFSDTSTSVRSIVKRARKKNIGISITDHNDIRGALLARSLAKDVMMIPGIEISSKERAHLLAYFYSMNDLEHFYNNNIKNNKSRMIYLKTKLGLIEIIDLLIKIAESKAFLEARGYTIVGKECK